MHVEESMNALLSSFDDDGPRWQGANDEDIEALQEIAGRPLPKFYEWFARTMGGDYASRREDLRVSSVLAAYREGIVAPDPRYLLIGRNPMPPMPQLVFYDLDAPCRDDALVVTDPEGGPPLRRQVYETLREKLAMNIVHAHVINKGAQQCRGYFSDAQGAVKQSLAPVLEETLGFTAVVDCGPHCCVYRRDDGAALVSLQALQRADGTLQSFWFAGPDAIVLRRALGEITTQTMLHVKIDEWLPPL